MSKKLTPWFPGDVKPVRAGYYERDWDGDGNRFGLLSDYWDGRAWRNVYRHQVMAQARHSTQNLPWRGLAAPVASKEVA